MNRRLAGVLYLLCTLLVSIGAGAQVFTDPDKAFATAADHNRQVLLVFQGSDWCIPCIRLERQVLSTPRFLQFAEDSLVVLKADFPQRSTLAPALAARYEKLAEAFNPEGAFPKLLLLNAQQQPIASLPVTDGSVASFIDQIKVLLRTYAAKI